MERVDSLASRELTLSGSPVHVARLPPAPFSATRCYFYATSPPLLTSSSPPARESLRLGEGKGSTFVANALRLWQTVNHELVRVIDHFSQLDIRDSAFDLHRVPVFLVQSGSHFKFALAGTSSSEASANILPPTLKTRTSGPNGVPSVASGLRRQYSRNDSKSILV